MRLLSEANDWTRDMDARTFDRFDRTAPGVEEGYQAAREFADLLIKRWSERKDDRLLMAARDPWAFTLWGTFGGGKTYLGAAVGNLAKSAGVPVLYCYALNLWAYLGCVQNPDPSISYEARFSAVIQAPLLILDEPGGTVNEAGAAVGMTEGKFERRRRLVEYRYAKRLPTVFLDQRSPRLWGDGAVATRIDEDANATIMHGEEDYRNRQKRLAWAAEIDQRRSNDDRREL